MGRCTPQLGHTYRLLVQTWRVARRPHFLHSTNCGCTQPGWHCDITSVRKYEDLPEAARGYVEYLEKAVGCKIKYISVGPERDACIIRD